MRPKIIIGMMIFLVCLSSAVSLAQDPGDPDTVRLANISGEIGQKASMPVFLYNDEELVSVVIPLLLDGYSGWLTFDSVSYAGSRLADPTILDNRQVYVFGTDTFTVDSLLLSFSISSGNNLPADTGKLCDLWFTLHFGGEVLVHSLSNSPQGGLALTTTGPQTFIPQFSSGLVNIPCDYLIGDVGPHPDGEVNSADIITFQKLWFYDWPPSAWPVADRYGAADVNCDRRVDFRDVVYLTDYLFQGGIQLCTCGTINPPYYNDPGSPDTVWVESETLIVGVSSPICIGIINDESLTGMTLALEWDGTAVLEREWGETVVTDRIDPYFWHWLDLDHADGVNPDTFLFYAWRYPVEPTSPVLPGRDAICCPHFIPRSLGTVTFRLVSWLNAGESMLVTEDHAAISPAFYSGNITVLAYLPGDPNHDGKINSADVVYLINYLFVGGPEPDPLESGDASHDGMINSADVAFLINYLFCGGPAPGR
jgi:hypothetical protein